MNNLTKIIKLLTNQERKKAVYLLIMILIVAVLDAVGVASIMPFIAVLTNPDIIQTNTFLNKTFVYSEILGIKTNKLNVKRTKILRQCTITKPVS